MMNVEGQHYKYGKTPHQQAVGAAEIFRDNRRDMIDANTIGADKYFHAKANAEATQLGKFGEATAHITSGAREIFDIPNNLILKGYSVEEAFDDMRSDLQANRDGRVAGKNRNKKARSLYLVRKHRPKGLDDKY